MFNQFNLTEQPTKCMGQINREFSEKMKRDAEDHAKRLANIERMIELASSGATTADAELAALLGQLTKKKI